VGRRFVETAEQSIRLDCRVLLSLLAGALRGFEATLFAFLIVFCNPNPIDDFGVIGIRHYVEVSRRGRPD
jgi:hypothetical protein